MYYVVLFFFRSLNALIFEEENIVTRETREGWPLLTVEMSGDSKNTNERDPFLVG
jgi:hypothetical protein